MAEKKTPWNLFVGAALIVALFVAWFLLPVKEWIESFTQWVEALGFWGGVIYAVFYAIATVLLVPGAPLTIAAGLVFGVTMGFPIVLIGATIGAAFAFLAARHLVREKVNAMVEERPKLKAVDRAVAEEGWKIVVMVRLTPIMPFNLQNYFFGLTEIQFWHYVAATLVGIIPGVLLYLYLGAIGAATLGGGAEFGPLQWGFFGLGLVVTILAVALVTKKAKAKLEQVGVSPEKA
jgi:uncharacterized membrane protein YdjX (TVP38/TMEM64 family)